MSENMVMSVIKDAIQTGLIIAAPILIVSMLVGLLISIFQATTQIQEQTLTFVPKLIAVAVVGLITGVGCFIRSRFYKEYLHILQI